MTDHLQSAPSEAEERKPYYPPAIVHELKLETRAGSPLRPDLPDPLGIDPTNPNSG
jgi:hypothetical protein